MNEKINVDEILRIVGNYSLRIKSLLLDCDFYFENNSPVIEIICPTDYHFETIEKKKTMINDGLKRFNEKIYVEVTNFKDLEENAT